MCVCCVRVSEQDSGGSGERGVCTTYTEIWRHCFARRDTFACGIERICWGEETVEAASHFRCRRRAGRQGIG